MSKHRAFYIVFFAFVQILQIFTNARGQTVEATIKIDSATPQVVAIAGKKSADIEGRNLSFLTSAAGIVVSGERITDLKLFDSKGDSVSYKRFIPGEYVADAEFERWSYKIDLTSPKSQSATAHVSWVTASGGILMLDDMLPQLATKDKKISAGISLELPAEWRAFSDNQRTNGNVFGYENAEKSVIFIGKDLLNIPVTVTGARLQLIFEGGWNFTFREAAESASGIYSEYRNIFGSDNGEEIFIALIKFPNSVNPGLWEAETRGRNITIISSDMPFKTQSLQRLHEQLRHELLHLWLPNGMNLKGNYDWFYEGFALYESLKLGVSLNRIRFDDFLNTLSRALSFDNAFIQRKSLIETSKNRWSGANTQVYARGLLVAFLCDVAMLEASKGKRSVAGVLRDIYKKHKFPAEAADGNEAVLNALRANKELLPILEKYINGTEDIDLSTISRSAGIENSGDKLGTNLKVTAKPTGSQKALLDKLGYNSWRKLSVNSK